MSMYFEVREWNRTRWMFVYHGCIDVIRSVYLCEIIVQIRVGMCAVEGAERVKGAKHSTIVRNNSHNEFG